MSLEPVGLIAGTGDLPLRIAQEAKERGYGLVLVAIRGMTEPSLESMADETAWIKLGQLGKAVSVLKSHGVTRVIWAGKFDKAHLMRLWRLGLDRRAIKFILSLKDWKDDSILAGLANEFAKDGLIVEQITSWAGKLMAPLGVLTKRWPSAREWKDIEFGREMAKGIGRLDIGQMVVVKNSAVIVVEAIEGTDKAIRRVADLNMPYAVVVKMAKPQQDMRFDVPGVGPPTIESMVVARAGVLAVEAGRTMIPKYDEMIRLANKARISIVGIPAEGPLKPGV